METLGKGGVYPLEDKPRSKCRKWQIRVSVGINPRTSKYRQVTKVVNGTWTKVNNEKAKFIKEISDAPVLPEGKITLEQACELWSNPANRIGEWSKNTESTYKYCIKSVCRYMGKMRVDLISRKDVAECIREMQEDGLKPKTINIYMKCMSTMYSQFVLDNNYAVGNPFYSTPRPAVKKRDVIALSVNEYNGLINKIINMGLNSYTIATLLALCAGLRANECISEQWKHNYGNRMHIVGTKTESSDATVPISSKLKDALTEWKDIQQSEMKKYDLEQTDETYIVTDFDFKELEYHKLNTWWRKVRKQLEMEEYRFHDLRHLFVSYCVMQKLPPEVTQKLARHARFQTTMDVYSHLNDSYLDDYAARL